jgi:MFS family permease
MARSSAGGFYGWRIVAAAFVILFVSVGIALYTPPVFLPALEREFGWSRAAISAAISIGALVGALLSPLVGRWIDRWGARRVMSIGGLLMASGFLLLSRMDSLWQMYAFNLMTAMGVTSVAWIPNQTLISNWFERKRGLAMGITLAGIGFGGLLMAPLTSTLISALGWRFAYAGLSALILFVVVTLSLTVVRSEPAELGLLPDGDLPAPPDAEDGSAQLEAGQSAAVGFQASLGLGEAVRTSSFWIIALSYFLVAFGQLSIVFHLVAFLGDAGFDDSVGAWSLGLAIGASVGGARIRSHLRNRTGRNGGALPPPGGGVLRSAGLRTDPGRRHARRRPGRGDGARHHRAHLRRVGQLRPGVRPPRGGVSRRVGHHAAAATPRLPGPGIGRRGLALSTLRGALSGAAAGGSRRSGIVGIEAATDPRLVGHEAEDRPAGQAEGVQGSAGIVRGARGCGTTAEAPRLPRTGRRTWRRSGVRRASPPVLG